ncbi:hypothetical protein D0Z00_004161 [Geotrichum galactomycetum]|uniref:Uncharacterized protein n=1 Tax=Geotrichum galactomycetum TaxID=27317 RepID=A0ACB6UZ69_9ASCO|nr:hypothetical protein D0Z00_004161 [Geotrichum candidum]
MVAINKILFAGAFAAAASAAPFASADGLVTVGDVSVGTAITAADIAFVKDIEALLASTKEKRDTNGLAPITTLLNQAGSFLGETLRNLLTLNVAGESDSVAKLLVNVNQFLLDIEESLKKYTPATGLGGLLQNVLVQSGLQSLVLGLTSLITVLVSSLVNGGKTDPAVVAQIQEIQAHITNISNSSQGQGLLAGVNNLVVDLLKSIGSLLSKI